MTEKRGSENATPTPTRSEMKLHDIYKTPDEPETDSDSDEQSEGGDSDSDTDSDVIDQEEMLEGHILIGVEILSQYITSQLLCGFCHSEVSLIEVQSQGLASELAFHCRNGRCKGGQSFPSCQKIEAGNLQTSSMNRRTALAMRSIGCDHADLRTFCAIMNLPPASNSTHQHIKNYAQCCNSSNE